MHDETESLRRNLLASGQPHADLAATEGRTWNMEEVGDDFEILGFMAPFVVARRRSDGVLGSLGFTHRPRVYFNWQPDAAP